MPAHKKSDPQVTRPIPAKERAGLSETDYLLRSPRNAKRLLAALRRAESGKTKPSSVKELRRELGIDQRG